ncbi:MAG: hypothetical protein M0Z45_04985 [Actinomycetota bacterium]|nr:hypothetical protein [Actinomycetota bacterium]
MTFASSDIENRIYRAWERLLTRDSELLQFDASERSITHKLAEHLQVEFSDWDVDCEYNRDGHDPKALALHKCPHGKGDLRRDFPDIVVHKRDTGDNLVAIEAKKSTSRHNKHDSCKLHAYRESLHYQYAYLVVFPISTGDKRGLGLREFET